MRFWKKKEKQKRVKCGCIFVWKGKERGWVPHTLCETAVGLMPQYAGIILSLSLQDDAYEDHLRRGAEECTGRRNS